MFELSIATRHIAYRRRQTALSILAITLAVSISLVLMSLTNGYQQLVRDAWIESIPHVRVQEQNQFEKLHLYKGVVEKIWKIPGVRSVSTRLYAGASFSHKDKVRNAQLIGVMPEEETRISKVGEHIIQGDLSAILAGRNIVLGAVLADRLKAKMGDGIIVSYPKSKTMRLTVVGIFETGTDRDAGLTYVSPQTAQEFLQEGDVVSSVVVALTDPFEAESVSEQISNWGYRTRTWQEDEPDAEGTIEEINFWRIVTIFMALAISTLGIANIMNMLVLEKTREIGMLMALGASRSNIRDIFLFESSILGLIGTAAGCAVGLSAVRAIGNIGFEVPEATQISHVPLLIHPWDLPTIAVLALLLTIIAGVYPAMRASRLDPVEALKG